MIEAFELTKRFGRKTAVDNLTFSVRPGTVTGFLGPNGSGKSTTMRCMLDLDRADGGATTFSGRRYRDLQHPIREVGALLDAGYVHPGRSGRNHLLWLAASNGIGKARVNAVLEMVGLTSVAGNRVKTYSLGMKQRLGLAGVLLGDPHTIILDEPANGLDPEGVRWIRQVLTVLAREGRSVLVSSHLLSEMALMADDLVVIGQGRLIEQSTVADFVERFADRWVQVASPSATQLVAASAAAGWQARSINDTMAEIRGTTAAAVGELAAANGWVLHELSPQTGSLEDAFLQATATSQEYISHAVPPQGAAPAGTEASA
jgi:ABC-2 type transport system ATP-binding protein